MVSKGILLIGACFGFLYSSDKSSGGLVSSSNQWVGGQFIRKGDNLKKLQPTEEFMEVVLQETEKQREGQETQSPDSYCSQIKKSFDVLWGVLTRKPDAKRTVSQTQPQPIEYACKNDPCCALRCCFYCLACAQVCCGSCNSDSE
mgnify:CR=1 FL=1